jgi:hypothetical protein
MRTSEIIREIQSLPIQKRFIVLEETIHSIRKNEEAIQMENAVEALYSDYKTDEELIAFANIDFEDFYEAR